MAEQIINNGASAGDPTAENIYTSFEKTKDNFSELYTAITTFLLKAGGTMTGVLQFANGTVSAPSAKVGADQKGLYHVDTDKLGVSIAGAKVGEFNSNGYSGLTNRIVLQDRKTSGTVGGAGVAASWNQRNINTTLINNITGASLGTNVFVLPVGKYYIKNINAVAYLVNAHRIRLYNVTSAAIQTDVNLSPIIGNSSYSSTGADTNSVISGYYFEVLSSAKTFRIDHYIGITTGGDDFGTPTSTGDDEVYLNIEIEKVG